MVARESVHKWTGVPHGGGWLRIGRVIAFEDVDVAIRIGRHRRHAAELHARRPRVGLLAETI